MTRKPSVHATFTEKLAIKALLDERLHPIEGTVLFRYEEGWDDEAISKLVREELTGATTSKIRNECFGKLYGKQTKHRAKNEERITLLEERFELLLDWLQHYGGLPAEERSTIHNGVDLNAGEPQ